MVTTDDASVGDIVRLAGGDERAIVEGRVFLDRKRVEGADEPVFSGEEVTIAPPQSSEDGVTILCESGDVVAANKPAGLPTIADHAGATRTLIASVARLLARDVKEFHATSRLDREVSGVVLFATSRKAIHRLTIARDHGQYERRYVALSRGSPTTELGTWDAPIGRARDPRHRAPFGKEATDARSRFAVVARAGEFALLALAPITGRTHQLRVHASHAGAPLLGDRVYGGPTRLTLPTGRVLTLRRIALHAARVAVKGPRGVFQASAPLPVELLELWSALGGDASAWDIALTCAL